MLKILRAIFLIIKSDESNDESDTVLFSEAEYLLEGAEYSRKSEWYACLGKGLIFASPFKNHLKGSYKIEKSPSL